MSTMSRMCRRASLPRYQLGVPWRVGCGLITRWCAGGAVITPAGRNKGQKCAGRVCLSSKQMCRRASSHPSPLAVFARAGCGSAGLWSVGRAIQVEGSLMSSLTSQKVNSKHCQLAVLTRAGCEPMEQLSAGATTCPRFIAPGSTFLLLFAMSPPVLGRLCRSARCILVGCVQAGLLSVGGTTSSASLMLQRASSLRYRRAQCIRVGCVQAGLLSVGATTNLASYVLQRASSLLSTREEKTRVGSVLAGLSSVGAAMCFPRWEEWSASTSTQK